MPTIAALALRARSHSGEECWTETTGSKTQTKNRLTLCWRTQGKQFVIYRSNFEKVDKRAAGFTEGDLFGVPARIFRISFSGELAYEINVKSDHGLFMWEKIMEIGKEFGIQPYGTEALSTLRIEMGHVAGPELDGRTIPYDVSLDGMVSKKKDFIGKRSLSKSAFNQSDRQKIVGLVPIDRKTSIPEGSHLVIDKNAKLPNPKLGHVSSSCWSVENNNPFSLAILKDGKNMIGKKLFAVSPLKNKSIEVEVISSHYVDHEGKRVRS